MNIGMIFKGIANGARNLGGNGILIAKKHAPEILIGTGIVGFVGTVISACKATTKAHELIEEKERREENVDICLNDLATADRYTQADAERDLKIIQTQTKWGIVKAYIPTVTMGVASIVLVLSGYRILNTRYVGVAAAYKTLEAGFERYRGNVVDRFGEEVDRQMLYSIKADELEATREDQKQRKLAEGDKKALKNYKSTYATNDYIIFDQYSDRWQRNWTADQVYSYLRQKESEANDMLMIRGHLFENEVRDMLGVDRTPAGCVVGWLRPKHIGCGQTKLVSFGLDEMPEEQLRAILSTHRNEDIIFHLILNTDGVIYSLINGTDEGANKTIEMINDRAKLEEEARGRIM